jgi:hypothetical protein
MEYSSKVSLSFASAMNLSACALRDASTQLAATTSQDDWGSHALRRTPREDCAAKYPQPQGHFYLSPGPGFMLYFPALDTVVKPLPLCPKSISG